MLDNYNAPKIMKILLWSSALLIVAITIYGWIIGCPNGYWSPSNHCDAICYGEDKGVYHFRMDEIIGIDGKYNDYVCPCNSKNIMVSKTCV